MKTLIIDNYDSFTYILKQYFGELGGNPEVFFHDEITVEQIKRKKPTHIVLSPGPGTVDNPKDVGITLDVIKEFYKKVPILGVCLGHQAICKYFGGQIIRAPKIMHGKRSDIYHTNQGIFKGIKSPFEAMRYHSLIVDTPFWMNSEVDTVAHTSDFLIMGIQHKKYPVFGVQFHPESLGTKEGKKLLHNFLNLQF
ncbi:aminodeoxychorismate/anthranilate synthase component II [Patescibacteria group bacterium]|nr:aminodeoxychorismate/anthranilate synthase component II [Patescibacteria group bacterium]MBU1683446.1 aminodeoxychorismate/anthranilate synthase component II [Patescibacteria group bacterium]MBU1934992.1 aminodeoxychorismate/anthranilate synthase component II [Patescibacteria group bacterium]